MEPLSSNPAISIESQIDILLHEYDNVAEQILHRYDAQFQAIGAYGAVLIGLLALIFTAGFRWSLVALLGVVTFIFVAVDSVPAILAITTDPYIVYTSNTFAILGLRALYFALAASVHRFHYLKYALALVLIFIGAKIFVNHVYGKLDPAISLGVTAALLAGGILFSLWKTRRADGHAPAAALPAGPTADNADA